MKEYYKDSQSTIYHGRAEDIGELGKVDCIITDPPYGARVHDGQCEDLRDGISYDCMTGPGAQQHAKRFVDVCGGWVCVFSCYDLAWDWRDSFAGIGLTTFAPVPCVELNMTVRLSGDGPSSWATYLNVARPKHLSKWGTLPGAYISKREKKFRMGGKTLSMMRAIVKDYSKPGDTILDPFMGGGTTLRAALDTGRKAIGVDIDEKCCEIAAKRMEQGVLFCDE